MKDPESFRDRRPKTTASFPTCAFRASRVRTVPSMIRSGSLALALLLPLMLSVGILVTHQIAGPIRRIERYLTSLRDGQPTTPCQLRKKSTMLSI